MFAGHYGISFTETTAKNSIPLGVLLSLSNCWTSFGRFSRSLELKK